MSAKLPELTSPFSLTDLTDGAAYQFPSLKLNQPNLFTRIGSLGALVVKVPSDRGNADFKKYVRDGETDPQDIRANETLERFENLDKALQRYPAFSATKTSSGDSIAHFLVVHRLQHSRLEPCPHVAVPPTRFIVLARRRWLFGPYITPAIVQQRMPGIRLFDMVDPMEGVFLSQFSRLKPKLRHHLEPLMNSDISIHIDWNIENFVWDEQATKLYYVDSKPTTLASRFSVEHNLASLRDLLLQ